MAEEQRHTFLTDSAGFALKRFFGAGFSQGSGGTSNCKQYPGIVFLKICHSCLQWINRLLAIHVLPSRFPINFSMTVVMAMVFTSSLILFSFGPNAHAAAIDQTSFDHLTTGFPLDGKHSELECQACHIGGVFDELPTRCDQCHNGVLAPAKSTNHIITNDACENCHTTAGFSLLTAALFDHSLVTGTPCFDCHNGISATGKGPNHIPSANTCEDCHNVLSWVVPGSAFDHSNVTGACVDCHDGVTARGKSPAHISTTDYCEACHRVDTWKPPILPLAWKARTQ